NYKIVPDLPKPLRIADDWEERNIILEDLKKMLGVRLDEIKDKLNLLSADWQTLNADAQDWRFPDPSFLSALREHQARHKYLLRAELVYRLKKAFEQCGDLDLEGPPEYVLVDEYQDLNPCDIDVVKALADRGSELFVTGDDDQSIYGFRKAHPEGIRRFTKDYDGASELKLSVCKRCDPAILRLGRFVAEQDYRRLPKVVYPEADRGPGEVQILRFYNQDQEARGVAILCNYLIRGKSYEPHEILVLLRSDRNRNFSSVLQKAMERMGVPVAAATADANPLRHPQGRQLLALLRLAVDSADHLAWRTLIQLRPNNLGGKAIEAVYELACKEGLVFSEALKQIEASPHIMSRFGQRLAEEVRAIRQVAASLPVSEEGKGGESTVPGERLLEGIRELVERIIESKQDRCNVLAFIEKVFETTGAESVDALVQALAVFSEDIEQEIEQGKVNILTMHKAKGLTAKAVFIVAAEDEYLPGRAKREEEIGDERRLLYVSLTRAKHRLFLTYCQRRTGPQKHSGRNAGKEDRTLSRFLRDGPIIPITWGNYMKLHPEVCRVGLDSFDRLDHKIKSTVAA
ncbi:MAG: 3'-5' exonuclease, partial [bacterium]